MKIVFVQEDNIRLLESTSLIHDTTLAGIHFRDTAYSPLKSSEYEQLKYFPKLFSGH
jgi:hypothetical protein